MDFIYAEVYYPFNDQCSHHVETSHANQLTGFYMMGTLVIKGLRVKIPFMH